MLSMASIGFGSLRKKHSVGRRSEGDCGENRSTRGQYIKARNFHRVREYDTLNACSQHFNSSWGFGAKGAIPVLIPVDDVVAELRL